MITSEISVLGFECAHLTSCSSFVHLPNPQVVVGQLEACMGPRHELSGRPLSCKKRPKLFEMFFLFSGAGKSTERVLSCDDIPIDVPKVHVLQRDA